LCSNIYIYIDELQLRSVLTMISRHWIEIPSSLLHKSLASLPLVQLHQLPSECLNIITHLCREWWHLSQNLATVCSKHPRIVSMGICGHCCHHGYFINLAITLYIRWISTGVQQLKHYRSSSSSLVTYSNVATMVSSSVSQAMGPILARYIGAT